MTIDPVQAGVTAIETAIRDMGHTPGSQELMAAASGIMAQVMFTCMEDPSNEAHVAEVLEMHDEVVATLLRAMSACAERMMTQAGIH